MSNYIESVFKMSKIEFIDTCDRYPCLKEKELILNIYNHIIQHQHPGPSEESDHEYHQIIASN